MLTILLVYTRWVSDVAQDLVLPNLEEAIRCFLYEEITESNDAQSVDLAACPPLTSRISRYHSATATFFAPSELSGSGGMHSEIIRANPNWRNECPRFDTVLIQTDPDEPGIKGSRVGRLIAFFSIPHPQNADKIPCALVEWFDIQGSRPSDVTGMWIVKPAMVGRRRSRSIVHIDSIIRSVHLIPIARGVTIPIDFHFSFSLDAFSSFYINKFADYHTHECLY